MKGIPPLHVSYYVTSLTCKRTARPVSYRGVRIEPAEYRGQHGDWSRRRSLVLTGAMHVAAWHTRSGGIRIDIGLRR